MDDVENMLIKFTKKIAIFLLSAVLGVLFVFVLSTVLVPLASFIEKILPGMNLLIADILPYAIFIPIIFAGLAYWFPPFKKYFARKQYFILSLLLSCYVVMALLFIAIYFLLIVPLGHG